MQLESGKEYRARTAGGDDIEFRVVDAATDWPRVDLVCAEGSETNVWLNLNQLLWIGSEAERMEGFQRTAEELIETISHELGQVQSKKPD